MLSQMYVVLPLSLISVLAHTQFECYSDRADFYAIPLSIYIFIWINDTGAYLSGVTLGKHKLCPNISPHKTVEGSVGGIVSSIIVSFILGFSFSFEKNLANAVILTIPFCILGMIGDLFASAIKRAAGIKDYGTIIPGHGGILDRFDSILMTAPLLYLFIALGVI